MSDRPRIDFAYIVDRSRTDLWENPADSALPTTNSGQERDAQPAAGTDAAHGGRAFTAIAQANTSANLGPLGQEIVQWKRQVRDKQDEQLKDDPSECAERERITEQAP